MTYNYPVLFKNIIAAVSGADSFSQRMNALIAHCESQIPHQAWSSFRELDFEADYEGLKHWLPTACAEATRSTSFKGLWFGLNNPVIDNEPTADLYIAASPMFDRGSIDWAFSATFHPESGYLNSSVLTSIYRLAYCDNTSLGNDAEYPLVLAYGAMAARAALETTRFCGPFTHLSGTAVGFDSGDFLFLGPFVNGTFNANVEAS